jgi:DNA-binding response OmpR family regulator
MRAGPTLLIVDDQPLMAEYMASIAEDAGWTVDLALTASEFELKVRTGEPDMIALDLAMPGRDGVELLRYLSANGYSGNLIIVSACDEPIVETAAMLAREHGLALTGYLQKPVGAEEVAALLEKVVAMIPDSALDRSH